MDSGRHTVVHTAEDAPDILFVLLDRHIMQRVLGEGYTHAALREFIPGDEFHRAKVIFNLLPKGIPVPEKATSLSAHCFTEGLQKNEKDFYLIFASGDVIPQMEAPCLLSREPEDMIRNAAS